MQCKKIIDLYAKLWYHRDRYGPDSPTARACTKGQSNTWHDIFRPVVIDDSPLNYVRGVRPEHRVYPLCEGCHR